MNTQDKIIDLPDIRFEGLLQEGIVYYRSEDVHQWLRECAKVACDSGIPDVVELFVDGMADALKRARSKSV